MDIRNRNDLELAYRILYTMADTIANATGMDKDKAEGLTKTSNYIIELKRSIRAYQHKASDRRCIQCDYDGYVELVEVPDVSDLEAWFDDNERLTYRPSAYDCTGQLFTVWHKFFRRNGHMMMYHRVAADV